MGQGTLTNAGRALFAAKQAASQVLVVDRFMLANIPGLVAATAENQNEPLPPVGQRVATLAVTQQGYVSPDSVVYSLYLGTEVGNYTFNWVGLLAADNTLVAVRYIEPINKFASAGGSIGNAITRNFLVSYVDAAAITNISVQASAWQFHHDQATEAQRGIAMLATQAETDAGTNDTKMVTPLKATASFVSRKSNSTITANTRWQDTYRAEFGTDADLVLYHNGGQNYIRANTGGIYIDQNVVSALGRLRGANSGGTLQDCVAFGGATPRALLYYGGAQRLETTNDGINILRAIATGAGTDLELLPGSGLLKVTGQILESGQRVYSPNVIDLVGKLAFFDTDVTPLGWLPCDGAAVSRTTYATLFARLGTRHGAGNGSTTFNLPDLRSDFLRALDNGRGVDIGRLLASFQDHLLASHAHLYSTYDTDNSTGGGSNVRPRSAISATTTATGGNETRPRNTAFPLFIKY